jgi:hypothetical protein
MMRGRERRKDVYYMAWKATERQYFSSSSPIFRV